MSSSSSSGSIDEETEQAARQAAIEVMEDFDDYSTLRNDARASMVPVFDSNEILLDYSSSTHSEILNSRNSEIGRFTVYPLKEISLRAFGDASDPPFSDQMEENRYRFADRSHEGHFCVKYVARDSLRHDRDPNLARDAICSLALEAKVLMNLPKHPHICQIYGTHAQGLAAGFGSRVFEENYFTIVDKISETLKQRISAWRKKEAYEGERFDDLEQRQSEVTQRLEVVLDIVSALEFLASQKLVFLFHTEKCGFDSRMSRIKLYDFGHAHESGKMPFFHLSEEKEMCKRVYVAPEVLKGEKVTVSADVFAVGMLLWEVLALKPPFQGMKYERHMNEVVKGKRRPHLSSQLPSCLKDVMEGCWGSPNQRMIMKDLHNKLEDILLDRNLLSFEPIAAKRLKSKRQTRQEIRESPKRYGKSVEGKHSQSKGTTNRNGEVHRSSSRRDISKSESPRKPSSQTLKLKVLDSKDSNYRSRSTHSSKMHSSPLRAKKLMSSKTDGERSESTKKLRSKSLDCSINEKKQNGQAVISTEASRNSKRHNSRGRPEAKERSAHRKPLSSPRLSRPISDAPPNFLESMRQQVASIRKNLSGSSNSEEIIPLSYPDTEDRGRGVRRSVSVRRPGSRRKNSRSSSREHISSESRSFSVRRSLSRGLCEENTKLCSSGNLHSPKKKLSRSTSTTSVAAGGRRSMRVATGSV